MRWSVTVPGQPQSWNSAYRTGKVYLKPDASGARRSIHRPVKTEKAAQYQNDVILLTRAARPSSWTPTTQVRVIIDLYLARNSDADNLLKILLDGAAKAIGINDVLFLPCVRRKESGLDPKDARVVLTFDDEV